MRHILFLSYASENAKDTQFLGFCKELSQVIAPGTPWSYDDDRVSFRDRKNLRLGEKWEPELRDALEASSAAVKRFTSVILASFAGIGLLLAVVGIYGVIAYLVAQRTQEIGIRLALGAPQSAVVWLVSSQGLRMALGGVVIGLVGTAFAARSMKSLLYGISALDPVTIGSASIVLIAIALGACVLPARRAAKIDPIQALRAE